MPKPGPPEDANDGGYATAGRMVAGVEAAWQTEIARRVEEIQAGKVPGIPGEEVSARVGKIVGR